MIRLRRTIAAICIAATFITSVAGFVPAAFAVERYQVIVPDICGTGVDIVASGKLEA